MLTRQLLKLFDFVRTYVRENGIGPSYDEMREHLGLASKSTVVHQVERLVERGYLVKLPHRARAIGVAPGKEDFAVPGAKPPRGMTTTEAYLDGLGKPIPEKLQKPSVALLGLKPVR